MLNSPTPFRIDIPDATWNDLQSRLERVRLLPDSPNRPASGMNASYLADLVQSWRAFDWPSLQAWLNGFPQFVAEIDDASIHFFHLRSENENAPALLVMHGWPHTSALQLDFARLLPDFDVIIPSLPGFAFSSAYRSGTWTTARVAATMHHLMTEVLGYQRYLTYGEDVSANINDYIAGTYPDSIAGIIATHAHFPSDVERAELNDPEVEAFFERLNGNAQDVSGYAHEQATRPDTLAAALNDSPAGLLAWITEKLVEWSDTPDGDPRLVERRISRERILTEASIYWVTSSIATSFVPYFEGRRDSTSFPPVLVPASVHIQRHEADYPEVMARNFYRDLRVFQRLEEGGHFAIAEVPEHMAMRVREFADELDLL